ncbi:hypothetical protein C3747_25g93 [Trypanosoma cruzi]|uniref:Uncharacterized protein n=2 Tax=Trypanosoma cruzi TaxID=5693 RepID=Q4DAF0_TRYCC|nr:hypothetical protein, conserved [Trypanosoma cruzi]EAN89493.1 hypothetical protein, conserved [Trypanosoma cruzi]PWV16068.1 hypothetical protein C3747_25g93 [Trypanosoma cruzi]|eukprot:XP_811344.1 hypothetical protein [Trypanosoma cruzi strain CL Brener]
MSQETLSAKQVNQPGVHAPEVKALLSARARYRTVVVVAVTFLLLACLFVISSSSSEQGEGRYRPRAIVLIVPHLPPDMLEAAMASNKAPFLGLISAADGVYARPLAKNTELSSSLVTILTGRVDSSATGLVGATSFLGKMKRAGRKPVVLAAASYWSAQVAAADGNCSRVGLFDSECSGLRCPAATEAAYCNAAEKLLSCDGKAQLYEEDVLEAFRHLMQHDGDLLYAHANALCGTVSTDEERMAVLSDISIMDSTLGKIALAVIERSSTTRESWLIMLVGAGGNGLERVPLVMVAYAKGGLVRFGPIPEEATLADVAPTVLHWFALSSHGDAQRVRGMCSTGVAAISCETTTRWP